MAKVTKEQALSVMDALKKFYSDYDMYYGPDLREGDFDWVEQIPDFAIAWEEGPEDWAMEFAYAAGSGEMAGIPRGVYVSPATSWAISLYVD